VLRPQSTGSESVICGRERWSRSLGGSDAANRCVGCAFAFRTTGTPWRLVMGRPTSPLGTHGRNDVHQAGSGRVRARARFRDYEGSCRAFTRWAGDKDEARSRLLHALAESARFPEGALAAGTRLSAQSGVAA
jgi:hypothetical protein